MSILKLAPSCKNYIWGGNKLKKEYGKQSKDEIIAETWELSCHSNGHSLIINGAYTGKTLSEYIQINGSNILGTNCLKFKDFPILIKLIDAKENLSIQVHPDNKYALTNEGQYGKTEIWYIVECDKRSYIYYGFNKEISRDELIERIENSTILEVLNKVYVKKGDVFFIEPGRIHSIGEGILLAEIQQSSNITYRVYDYGRIGVDGKQRELHITKALDVLKIEKPKEIWDFNGHLAQCEYFQVNMINVSGKYKNNVCENSFHSLLFLEGCGIIKNNKEEVKFKKGDSIFVEANSGEYEIIGECKFLLTIVP
ncbi:MAG: class I mannose-6-phosphate isomerase [Fusobacteriaceae bacterium]|jgi:mannose-6-phosphate isomerase|nr:class I mannose-6-phosphate isomerase [Fusobacteriaceae bacterium]